MRSIRPTVLLFALAILVSLMPPAMAQSFNIDLGPPETGPAPGYRAAGLPGYWHSFEATTWGLYYDLLDLDGNPTGARVRQIGGTEILVKTQGQPGQPMGGDAVLLEDALITHAVENCLFFVGLENGTYEVLSYTWMMTAPATLNHVWIDFHPVEPLIGGAWTGQLAQGLQFARHEYETVNGTINMHSGIPDGAPANPGAALNGVQLRKMTPEPPLFVGRGRLDWLKALDAIDYDVLRGDLETLRSTGGDFAASIAACMIDDTTKQNLIYAAEPGPGDGEWYLVRAADGLGDLTWNAPGSSQVGDRDPQLLGSCP